jgi:hypothetical protein
MDMEYWYLQISSSGQVSGGFGNRHLLFVWRVGFHNSFFQQVRTRTRCGGLIRILLKFFRAQISPTVPKHETIRVARGYKKLILLTFDLRTKMKILVEMICRLVNKIDRIIVPIEVD